MNILKEINISPARKDHLLEITEILQSVSKFEPSNEDVLKMWDNFTNQSNYYGLVALHNGKVIGYGSIFFITKIRGGKMGQIDEIATHENFRMKGVASLIMKYLCDLAIKNKCYKISLSCKENNISFYENKNFSLEGFHLNKIL